MSRKTILKTYRAIQDGDMSASITSAATNIEQIDYPVVTIEWANGVAINGAFTMEHQLDGSAWTAYDFGTAISLSGASGNHDIQFTVPLSHVNVRFNYIRTAGTGTINVRLAGKVIGA